MAVLRLGVPHATDEPVLLVENALAVGAHLFRLVVEDDDGQRSDPADVTVRVIEPLPPDTRPPIGDVRPPIGDIRPGTPIVVNPRPTPGEPIGPITPVPPVVPRGSPPPHSEPTPPAPRPRRRRPR